MRLEVNKNKFQILPLVLLLTPICIRVAIISFISMTGDKQDNQNIRQNERRRKLMGRVSHQNSSVLNSNVISTVSVLSFFLSFYLLVCLSFFRFLSL